MTTRTRTTTEAPPHAGFEDLNLDVLSDEELEVLLFDEEPEAPKRGLWNLPTLTGLTLIVVGIAYLLQELGFFTGFDLSAMAATLPWIAGVMIILLGFGVLSWRPGQKRKKEKKEKAWKKALSSSNHSSGKEEKEKKEKASILTSHHLTRSRQDRQIFGVCGGISERLNMDSTLVRIAFVIGTIASGGWPVILAYLALAYVMPEPEEAAPEGTEKQVRITRDKATG